MAAVRRAAHCLYVRLLWARASLADVALVSSVPVVLLYVFSLPMTTRRALAFDATNPTLWTAYVSHFVHFSPGHLLANLIGYLLLVPTVYVLSLLAARRRQFRVVSLALLLGFPFALSLANQIVLRPRLAIGFSGILLGFYGYLPFVLYQYLGRHADGRLPLRYAPVVFLCGLVSISFVRIQSVSPGLVVALGGLPLACLSGFTGIGRWRIEGTGRLDRIGFTETAVASVLLFLCYPLAAFQTGMPGPGVVNLLTHFTGYVLSFVGTYIVVLTTRWATGGSQPKNSSLGSGVDFPRFSQD